MNPGWIESEKRRIESRRQELISELWTFLRTCQDAFEWEDASWMLWQLKALPEKMARKRD